MKARSWIWFFAAFLCCGASQAFARRAVVWFTHPELYGRPKLNFNTKNPNFVVLPVGECDTPFLAGTVLGVPDPRIVDSTQVCGHGKVYLVATRVDTGTPPLLITLVTTPVVPDLSGSPLAIADSTKLIRDQLPKLDIPGGDRLPAVIELRNITQKSDASHAARNIPRRESK